MQQAEANRAELSRCRRISFAIAAHGLSARLTDHSGLAGP